MEELEQMENLLEAPLSAENPHELRQQLISIEAWLSRLSVVLRSKERELIDKQNKHQMPKSKTLTESDRKHIVNYHTRELKEEVDLLTDRMKIISQRLSLGQSILNSLKEEIKHGL